MPVAVCASKTVLILFNTIIFALGCAFIGISAYVLGGKVKSNIVNSVTFQVSIAVSVFIILLSLLGCRGTVKRNKISLRIYTGLALILLIGSIVLGGFTTVYTKDVKKLAPAGTESIAKNETNLNIATDKILTFIHNGFVSVYDSSTCINGGINAVPVGVYDPKLADQWLDVDCVKKPVEKVLNAFAKVPTIKGFPRWRVCMKSYQMEFLHQETGLWCRSNGGLIGDVQLLARMLLIVAWILVGILLTVVISSFILIRNNREKANRMTIRV